MQQNNFIEIECPLEITWRISKHSPSFKNLSEKRITFMDSPVFKCPKFPDAEYHLSLDCENQFRFILSKTGADVEVNLVAEIAGNSQAAYHVFKEDALLYHGICCYRSILFFDNGILTFKVKGTLKRKKMVLPFGGSKNIMLNLWNDEEKDFTIITEDGQEFQVHKCILRASSPVFTGMLKSGMKEAVENKVQIKGFDLEVIETAMKYCYGLNIFTSMPLPKAMSLLQFTDIYDIDGLKDLLESFLIGKLDATNVFELQEGTTHANSPKLEEKCLEFLNNYAENAFCHFCETL